MHTPSGRSRPARFGLPWLAAAAFVFVTQLTVRGDIAVLRQKGPWSGTIFSSPGMVSLDGDASRITMRTANVRINLSRGQGDTLVAKCEADFELENSTTGKTAVTQIPVAFPVTGLSSKIVTISGFTVTVDGRKPPIVLRQSISVSKFTSTVRDTPIFGQLEARLQPDKSAQVFSLADGSTYRNAYVWAQDTKPGTVSRVTISYTVELHPQAISYSTSYNSSDADAEVIPLADLSAAKWDGQYYFFDYVLLSGSTWSGPIGKETITLSIDPGLNLAARSIRSLSRHAVGAIPGKPSFALEPDEFFFPGDPQRDNRSPPKLGPEYDPVPTPTGNGLQWTISGKPAGDLLIAIPAGAIPAAPAK